MDAFAPLKEIVEDGFLSETNMQRGRVLLDAQSVAVLDRSEVQGKAIAKLLESCHPQFDKGDRIAAVKRYRSGSGCGLREAHHAVVRGK